MPPVNVVSVEAMLKISGIDRSRSISCHKIFNDTTVLTGETLKTKRKEIVAFLKACRKGLEENLKDPAAYPKKFADTWYKGTGRSVENEIYFNTAQKPLIESPKRIFSMSEETIAANIAASSGIASISTCSTRSRRCQFLSQ